MAKNLSSPIQRKPTSIPGNIEDKRGPGTLRRASDVTGPAIKRDRIQASRQSSRSNEAETKSLTASGLGDNPRKISRDELFPSQIDNYGTSLPVDG